MAPMLPLPTVLRSMPFARAISRPNGTDPVKNAPAHKTISVIVAVIFFSKR
ncbi:hypothetical protein MBAV_001104 [Candidatus Magnetobacterium bavaricum]|uniref:Uncharacterized protein n=1 Tax=Candidatus Magnetobacterium bavaricum TaxID=29290 RepID=A0A0F3GXR3_9BACT|nr:hypothetical protein MBAV_001104 [Candidatus Magnetobacterium bavaricum]